MPYGTTAPCQSPVRLTRRFEHEGSDVLQRSDAGAVSASGTAPRGERRRAPPPRLNAEGQVVPVQLGRRHHARGRRGRSRHARDGAHASASPRGRGGLAPAGALRVQRLGQERRAGAVVADGSGVPRLPPCNHGPHVRGAHGARVPPASRGRAGDMSTIQEIRPSKPKSQRAPQGDHRSSARSRGRPGAQGAARIPRRWYRPPDGRRQAACLREKHAGRLISRGDPGERTLAPPTVGMQKIDAFLRCTGALAVDFSPPSCCRCD